jgi:hypothetical protein
MNLSALLKRPSAFLPLMMSAAAFALVIVHVAMFGIVRNADEGAAARIFQLLIVAQTPIMAFFALKWLPRAPRQALVVLALQIAAAVAAVGLVIVLEM